MSKKKKQKTTQPLEISIEETEELLKRLEEKKLEDKDFEKIKAFNGQIGKMVCAAVYPKEDRTQ